MQQAKDYEKDKNKRKLRNMATSTLLKSESIGNTLFRQRKCFSCDTKLGIRGCTVRPLRYVWASTAGEAGIRQSILRAADELAGLNHGKNYCQVWH